MNNKAMMSKKLGMKKTGLDLDQDLKHWMKKMNMNAKLRSSKHKTQWFPIL